MNTILFKNNREISSNPRSPVFHCLSSTMSRTKKPFVVTLSDDEEIPTVETMKMGQESDIECIVLGDSEDAAPRLENKEAEPSSRKRKRSRKRRHRSKKPKTENLSTEQMIQDIKVQLNSPMPPTESQPSNTATLKVGKKRRKKRRKEPMFMNATSHTTPNNEFKNDPRVPKKWTSEMAHFYLDPVPELANLNLDKELSKMSNKGWEVTKVDQNRAFYACHKCNRIGHLAHECGYLSPREEHQQRNICHLCGVPGHRAKKCKYKLCRRCGNEDPMEWSVRCYHCVTVPEARRPCMLCNKLGHTPGNCDNNWRTNASTGSGDTPVNELEKPASSLCCCNCAKWGHASEDCTEPTMEQLLATMSMEEKQKLLGTKRKRSCSRSRRARGNAHGAHVGRK